LKKLVVDLDGTITSGNSNDYKNVLPNLALIKKLREYKANGFTIVIFTARNMRTYKGNIGKINVNTLPIVMDWLNKHNVPHDEVIVGKPWCGYEGFYIDDRAIRPSEFIELSQDEINVLIDEEK